MPLFPLDGIVMFPEALLPLHIFEPRYRKLTADVLAGDKLIVLGNRLEDEVVGAPPPRVAPIAGVGEVVMAHELPDGRYNLILRGRARVRIDEELPSELPYRLVCCSEVPDDLPRSARELAEAEALMRSVAGSFAAALPELGEKLRALIASQPTPAALVDVLAASLVSNAALRQRLLETTDVIARLEIVSAEIAAAAAQLGDKERAN